MDRLKISDGDLVIIAHAKYESSTHRNLIDTIRGWINERGLNVKVVVGDVLPKDSKPEITILTVNDVFDNEVLKR